MSRLVSRAESWERVYEAFQNINFAAFDYDTVKRSILDYVKLYFPETFNDFIESSEFIALVETFAYIAELLAYRLDVNAHENFISTAQRRDSILRLAKLVSYTASRQIPARGLVKLSSVKTTETVLDTNGNNLANVVVRWNDPSNADWKDQFLLIMNRVLDQEFGTVGPNDRFQIQDVVFEVYGLDLVPLTNGVFTYSADANGTTLSMELVPITHDDSLGIIERRPAINSNFTLLYGSDGLGDASETTGFFCYTKQGSLQRYRTTFDGITSNITYDVPATDVNDTDVWLNNVDPATGETLDLPSPISFRPSWTGKSGEWVQVDLAHAQNVIFNTNPNRNKYEVETRTNNQVRLIFGDGEYADIPSGTFDVWVRTSEDADVVVPQSSVVDTTSSFTYTDSLGRTQTFTFTFSLIGSLQNASAAETVDHVRTTAPAVYYSQDRMVNGEDYNTFMLQDSSILKLRAINRTFAGDSKYITWHDSSNTYENVKIFGDDGIVYFEDIESGTSTPVVDTNVLISTYVEPLLSSTDIFLQLVTAGVPVADIHRVFTTDEHARITDTLTPPPSPTSAYLYFNTALYSWYSIKSSDDPTVALTQANYPELLADYPTDFITMPLIKVTQQNVLETSYTVTRVARRIIFQSTTTSFWSTNDANTVVDYDTLNSDTDTVTILKANTNYNRDSILQQNWIYNILGQEIVESGPDLGLPDINRVSVLSQDENGDRVPDYLDVNDVTLHKGLADFINPKFTVDLTGATFPLTITLPTYFINGQGDVSVTGGSSVSWYESGTLDTVQNTIVVSSGSGTITIVENEYVYFTRISTTDPWYPAETSIVSMNSYIASQLAADDLWKRQLGRDGLNFAWFHYSPRYYLVDPAPSNIIDSFIITKGYYTSMKRWLEDPLATQPDLPTPLDLRTSYSYLLDNKMISDTVILHPGKIKLLFGSKAISELQATFSVIRSPNGILTDNQVKTQIVATIRNFFDITSWEFGETFFFTELAAAIHSDLPTEISSVVLVPSAVNHQFGELFEVSAREDEVLYPDVTVDNITIVTGYTTTNLRLNG